MPNYKTEYLYAQMSNASYDTPSGQIDGWTIVKSESNAANGFAATAYRSNATGDIVIAYRGSDDFKDFDPRGSADLALASPLAAWNSQFTDALEFAKDIKNKYPNEAMSVTGHSLGGGLAQVVSKAYGLHGVTFDPAGAANIVKSDSYHNWTQSHGLGENGKGMPANFHNYLVAKSAVSHASGAHLGATTEFSSLSGRGAVEATISKAGRLVGSPIGYGYDTKQSHSMDRIEGVFKEAVQTGQLPKPLPILGQNEPVNTNPLLDTLKERVTDKTTVAVSGLCDKVGLTDERIRGNLCYGMTDIALNADFTGKGTITAGLNGNNITLVEERSIGDRSYAMGDSAVIGNIDQAISQANIAAFKPSEQAMKVDDPALAVAMDSPAKARSIA